jgi:signal peptidase II
LKKWILFFSLLLGLDAAAKWLALEFVPALGSTFLGYPFGGIPIFDWIGVTFSLNAIGNTGAAWGLFQGHSGLLFLFRSLIIGALILYILFYNRGKSPSIPLWLVATGAVGNAIDYWAYGHVIDFFHFCFWGYSFPIFNLADSYITMGVFFLLIASRSEKVRPVSL